MIGEISNLNIVVAYSLVVIVYMLVVVICMLDAIGNQITALWKSKYPRLRWRNYSLLLVTLFICWFFLFFVNIIAQAKYRSGQWLCSDFLILRQSLKILRISIDNIWTILYVKNIFSILTLDIVSIKSNIWFFVLILITKIELVTHPSKAMKVIHVRKVIKIWMIILIVEIFVFFFVLFFLFSDSFSF
jgi:hypothetical protein